MVIFNSYVSLSEGNFILEVGEGELRRYQVNERILLADEDAMRIY